MLGSISGCTGHAHQGSNSVKQHIHDSLTNIKLENDAAIMGTVVRIANTGSASQSFHLAPYKYDLGNYGFFALTPLSLDFTKEEEKDAILVWKFIHTSTHHSLPLAQGRLPHDPMRLVNSFGSGLCDDRNTALASTFKILGYDARVVSLGGHMVAEVEYDDSWHMFDADLGVYYRDNLGRVASVQYLSSHPEIIKLDFGQGLLRNALSKLGTAYIKSLYASAGNNEINTWQTSFQYNYIAGVSLGPRDEMYFTVRKLNTTEKFMQAVFLHSLYDYKSTGILKRTVALTGKECVVQEGLPYAVTQLRLRAENSESNTQVYYSPDSLRWFYKGTLTGSNEIAFVPFSVEDEPCSFNYLIKYVPENGSLSGTVKTECDFLFSPLLFTNPEKTFKIVAADSMARNALSVKIQYTK